MTSRDTDSSHKIPLYLSEGQRNMLLAEPSFSQGIHKRLQVCTVKGNFLLCHFEEEELIGIADLAEIKSIGSKDSFEAARWNEIYLSIVQLIQKRAGVIQIAGNKGEQREIRGNIPNYYEEKKHLDAQGDILSFINNMVKTSIDRFKNIPYKKIGGLSRSQLMRLINDDWNDPNGCVQLNSSLPLEAFDQSELLINSRTFLIALKEFRKVKATTAGNLNRKFVTQMLETFEMSEESREDIYRFNKVINEEDVFPLHFIRILFELAKLIKCNKGQFTLTRNGQKYAEEENAGSLFTLLFQTNFKDFDLAYCDRMEVNDDLQATVAFSLYMVGKLAGKLISPKKLAPMVILPKVRNTILRADDPYHLEWMVDSRIFRHLLTMGLLEKKELPTESKYMRPFHLRKTALYDRFMRFDV